MEYLQWLIEDQDSEDTQFHTTYVLLLAKSAFETENTSQNSEAGNLEETNMSMFQSPIRERLHINFRAHPVLMVIGLLLLNGEGKTMDIWKGLAFSRTLFRYLLTIAGELRQHLEVWDAVAGRRQYIFEGHEAPVYSVCPHCKENIQFIFSTAIDGKIKAWLYDCLELRVDYDAPGL
ncbi:unnamed protein product [Camellia sinensis]